MKLDRQQIFKISVAQKLLRRGFTIVDIARDKRNKEKTIFYFEKTPEFYKAWKEIREEETN
jgi:hypothetical protein